MAGIDPILILLGASLPVVGAVFLWAKRPHSISESEEDRRLRLEKEAAVAEAMRILHLAQRRAHGRARLNNDDIARRDDQDDRLGG
jgi:hypothetical protein